MNERTTLEKIAPTVEEAVSEGLAELNLPAEVVDVEVLDTGSRGLFGVGGRQARVRLTTKGTQPPRPEAGAPAPAPEPIPAPAPAPEPAPEPLEPIRKTLQPPSFAKHRVASCKDSCGAAAGTPPEAGYPDRLLSEEDELLNLSEKTVSELLAKMKIEAKLSISYGEPDEEGHRPVCVELHGDDLGILVGRRAEILNALQYIVNLIVSKQLERWVQIVVDVEGYRSRHEVNLRKMARQMAGQAVQTGRRQVLEPMSAADRRIIHLELRDHTDVTTQSIGEEPARKVTIVPK